MIDLAHAYGGDILADLAAWSVSEPAELTRALFTGHQLDTGPDGTRLRLTLHRLHAAAAPAVRSHRLGNHGRAGLHITQLRTDLDDLHAGIRRPIPLVTPPAAADTHRSTEAPPTR